MTLVAAVLIGIPAGLFLYAYVGYPAVLVVLSLVNRSDGSTDSAPAEWPTISISLPAHNEEDTIRGAIEALLTADYPENRRQIVVVSDASTDRTDEIVREYQDRGVELVRVEKRGGKTAAENAAVPHLDGEIVVNTDASVRVLPDSLKVLVRQFRDTAVGVASGRDRSVAADDAEATEDASNAGEAGYVGYEMWVRSLETDVGGIVGASGCFYAIRRKLHEVPVPPHLSRDFAAALNAREHGYRSVSVDDAVCLVPRTGSLRGELRRKVRTMARGLGTLFYKRYLLNPLAHGSFAWKLMSHKLCRWVAAGAAPLAVPGLVLLSTGSALALAGSALLAVGAAAGVLALLRPEADLPRPVTICGYLLASATAGILAWGRALRGEGTAVWSPTRR